MESGEKQSAVFILRLSFAHTKALFFLLHGSAILLSVPFEDIFQSGSARDLQSFEATSYVCV